MRDCVPLRERDGVQIQMRVGVAAEVESGLHPHAEQRDARRVGILATVQLDLVDESDRRDMVSRDARHQRACDVKLSVYRDGPMRRDWPPFNRTSIGPSAKLRSRQ